MTTTNTATALWGSVLLPKGDMQHVRMPLAVVTVTAEQAHLGLGA